jgi:hypothetical protein
MLKSSAVGGRRGDGGEAEVGWGTYEERENVEKMGRVEIKRGEEADKRTLLGIEWRYEERWIREKQICRTESC